MNELINLIKCIEHNINKRKQFMYKRYRKFFILFIKLKQIQNMLLKFE